MADITVEYIDHLGDDLRVVNAARVSFAKTSNYQTVNFESRKEAEKYEAEVEHSWLDEDYILSDRWFGGYPVKHLSESDRKLICYLAKHRHEMPFAHCQITVRVKVPVPIARQAFKSKVGFVESEESRRYIKSTPEVYFPKEWRSAPEGSIKQGSSGTHSRSDIWKREYEDLVCDALNVYENMIADGVCPEQARFILPQGAMVNWVWTGSLLAFSRFYRLRADSHAQKEIQALADQIDKIARSLFPVSWAALVDTKVD